ncbi:MAG: ABC transporter permease [Planctomycetaceae bacterium]
MPTAGNDWYIVGGVAALLGVALVWFTYFTRAGVISRATTKEAVRQPVFALLMAIALIISVVNTFLPFFTLGEDFKLLIDCGMMTILFCGLLQAVWTASTGIADEIEGRTAMTLLSKPITRAQFVIGKYIGILTSIIWLLLPVVICFVALVYYKVGYDAKESGNPFPEYAERIAIVQQVIPPLILAFLEIAMLTAVSVAISTRLPMVVNMVACFAIFVIGNLTPVMVQAGVLKLEFVSFMARLIATVLPTLDHFNVESAISTGTPVPAEYIGVAAAYSAAYSAAAIIVALLLFEDRDLA